MAKDKVKELTNIAFSIIQIDGKYQVASVKFDFEGNSDVTLTPTDGGLHDAVERFKILVSESGIIG